MEGRQGAQAAGRARRLLAGTSAGLLAILVPWLAADPSGAAQPQLGNDTILAERIVRVATFDCNRFRRSHNGGPNYTQALAAAFSPRPGRPNPQIGRWQCQFHDGAPHGLNCYSLGSAPLRVHAERARLELAVRGSCATIHIDGPNVSRPAPGVVAIRLGRSQRVSWSIRTNHPPDLVWRNHFHADLGLALAPPSRLE